MAILNPPPQHWRVKGPFVHSESATSDVEEDEVLDVLVDEIEEELLLEEVVLTLLVDVVFVDEEVVVFFVEDVAVTFLAARRSKGAASKASSSFSPMTAADAARLKDRKAHRPNLEINILSRTKEKW